MLRHRTPLPRTKVYWERRPAPKSPVSSDEEEFTGWVRGREASTYEERFYRQMVEEKRIETIHFERIFGTVPHHIQLDFLFWVSGQGYAVQLDGFWIHKTATARAQDVMKDVRLVEEFLRYQNIMDVSRVSSKHIETPDDCDIVIQHLLAGRVYRPWETE